MTNASSRLRWLLIPAVVTVLFHFPVLVSDFVWDDVALIRDHPRLSDPAFVRELFVRDYGLDMGGRQPAGYYRPLLMLINFAIYHVFGPHPLPYHLLSLLLGCCSVTLLAWVLFRLNPEDGLVLPVVAGSIVAAHPARTELLSFFMTLPDLLIEILGLLFVFLLVREDRAEGEGVGRRLGRAAVCASAAFLGGIAKEPAFFVFGALGFTALVWGWWGSRGRRVSWVGVSAFVGLLPAYALRRAAGIQALSLAAGPGRAFTDGSGRVLHGVATAMREIVIPSPAIFMDWSEHPAGAVSLAGVVALGVVFGLVLLYLVRKRWLLHLALTVWFGAGMAGLVAVTAVQIPYAARYIPIAPAVIELCFLARWLLRRAAEKVPSVAVFLAAGRTPFLFLAAYVCLHGGFTLASSILSTNRVSFFAAMADANPNMAYPRMILANLMLYEYGDFEQMERYAREAIALSPDTVKGRELGMLYAVRFIAEKKYDQALRYLRWSEQVLTNNAEVLSLKAVSFAGLGRRGEALDSIRGAIALAPKPA